MVHSPRVSERKIEVVVIADLVRYRIGEICYNILDVLKIKHFCLLVAELRASMKYVSHQR